MNFFKNYDLRALFPKGFDVAFLDGMHRFEYLLRDFINAERFCHGRSIVFLHDCFPATFRMAERVSIVGEAWTGDVWRILPALKKYRPDLRIVFLDCPPTGLVACTRLDSSSKILSEKFHDIVDEFFHIDLNDFGLETLWRLFPIIDTKKNSREPPGYDSDIKYMLTINLHIWC